MQSETEKKQQEHYNRIANEYELHYDGKYSQLYRDRFMHRFLFDNLDLKNKQVLEAMCGSGQTTGYLLKKGALVTGNDISDKSIERYKQKWPQCNSVCSSVLNTSLESNTFDCVVVIGGLHHLHPHVNEALAELHRVLKKGGHLCFHEPHKGSLPDKIRAIWYKRDAYFEENEESVDYDKLQSENADKFDVAKMKYGGNIAYLLVLQSLIFRIPLPVKNVISLPLIWLEALLDPFFGKSLSCFVMAQWVKK